MDRETNDLIARQYLSEKNLSQVEPSEFAKWANAQLEKGHDTPRLRSLAQGEAVSDIDARFRECILELGWEFPGRKSSLKRYSKSIMQSIVEGAIEPYDGCSQLYVNSIYLGHPDYLYNWNFLFWSMEDLDPEELNPMIMEEAIRALGEKPAASTDSADAADQAPLSFWDRVKELFGF